MCKQSGTSLKFAMCRIGRPSVLEASALIYSTLLLNLGFCCIDLLFSTGYSKDGFLKIVFET